MCALEALKMAWRDLSSFSVDSPRQTAEVILSELLGVRPNRIYLEPDMVLDREHFQTYFSMVERRKKGEPLARIVGNVEFMGLKLVVSGGVFIPRPETEVLCEIVAGRLMGRPAPMAADICTGCGAVGLALTTLVPGLTCYGTDISHEALEVARLNAGRLGVSERTFFLRGHLADALKRLRLAGRFDCVISNPPYIREKEMKALPVEVREHEPPAALNGGVDGLDFYRPVAEEAAFLLKPGGLVALEVGEGSSGDVADVLEALDFCNIEAHHDLRGVARFVTGSRKERVER